MLNIVQKNSKRITWIDFAKGLLMILVIWGHTVEMGKQPDNIIRGLVYSFHMPCFFLLSGVVYKTQPCVKDNIKKPFCRLIIPVAIVFVIKSIYKYLTELDTVSISEFIADKARALFWASGVSFAVNGKTVSDIGYIWFLVVLFEIRILYELVMKIKNELLRHFIVVLMTVSGVVVQYFYWLPFSVDIAFAAFVFFYIGVLVSKKIKCVIQTRWMLVSLAVWICTLGLSYLIERTSMELACRKYTLFPLGYITALSASVVFIYFCKMFEKIRAFHFLCIAGRYSLSFLLIHYLDGMISFLWKRTDIGVINSLIRSCLDITLLMIYAHMKMLINFYRKKLN